MTFTYPSHTTKGCVPLSSDVTSAGNDKWAFDKFKNILISSDKIRTMHDLDEEKTRYLLERWTGKRMKFFKRKVLVKK